MYSIDVHDMTMCSMSVHTVSAQKIAPSTHLDAILYKSVASVLIVVFSKFLHEEIEN
jgi:hypothetical protein